MKGSLVTHRCPASIGMVSRITRNGCPAWSEYALHILLISYFLSIPSPFCSQQHIPGLDFTLHLDLSSLSLGLCYSLDLKGIENKNRHI